MLNSNHKHRVVDSSCLAKSIQRALQAIALVTASVIWAAEPEASQSRAYLHWRVGEFAPAWGVLDLRGISLGLDLDSHWSAELALDAWQLELDSSRGTLGEQQIITLGPHVRYRFPLHDRIVPYALAGIGGAWVQFNDRQRAGFNRQIDADGMTLTGTVGAGLDLFLARNIAFNVEAKYVWADPLEIRLDAARHHWDPSSLHATLGLRIYFDRHATESLLTTQRAMEPLRFYFATQGGVSVLTDDSIGNGLSIDPKLNALAGTLNVHYTLALGLDAGKNWGIELALAHTEYSLLLDDIGPVTEYSVYSIMPLVRWRWPVQDGRWVPYVLGGAGFAYAESNDTKPVGHRLDIDAKGIAPAIAVGAGLDYFLARNLAFNVEARWRHTWGHDVKVAHASSSGDHSEVQLGFGFRAYLFEWNRPRRN